MGNGDLGLIFGNPGGGKSWALIAIGAYAASLGFNVLHYTLELGDMYIGRRYDAFFSNIPVNKIDGYREEVENILSNLKGQIIIKEFPPNRVTISTIEAHIKKIKELGITPDLVIIDYIDLLSTKKKTQDRKEEIDDIYSSTKGLAKELDLPIWSVSQVNRAGAKDDIIEGDKSAGSYDKTMIADVSISLSRKRKDKVEGTGRFHFMKNRYGLDGLTFFVRIDTATGHLEILEEYEPEEGNDSTPSPPKNNPPQGSLDKYDMKTLRNKFFELQNKQ